MCPLSTEDAIQQLLAIEEIKQVKARYCRFVDTERWDDFRDLFTEDVVLSMDDGRYEDATREEFVDGLKRWRSQLGGNSVHHVHSPEITLLSADRAVGIWAMGDILEYSAESGRQSFSGHGHYHEEYRRDAGVWRISSVRLTRLRRDPFDPATGHGLLPR